MKILILALSLTIAATAQVKPRKPPLPLPPVPVQTPNQHDASQIQYVQGSDVNAEILKSDMDVSPEGFGFSYETANGIAGEAKGELAKAEQVDFIKVTGQYNYVSPDGNKIQVSYVADENGYQPQSDILPVAPPVPPAIARALEYIASHPPYEYDAAKKH